MIVIFDMFNKNSLTIKGSIIFRLKPGHLFVQVLMMISAGIIFRNISFELFSKTKMKKSLFQIFT